MSVPDVRRQRIHDGSALYVGVAGKPAVCFGALLTAIGLLMFNFAARGVASRRFEDIVIGVCIGGMMLGLGLFLAHLGAGQLGWVGWRRRAPRLPSTEPWLADHDWDHRGSVHSGWKLALESWAATGFVLGLMIPATLGALQSNARGIPMIIVGFFDLIALLLICGSIRLTVLCLQGKAAGTFRYDRFPFFLGEELSGGLLLPETVKPVKRVELTLRFVAEEIVCGTDGPGKIARSLESYQEYADVIELDSPSIAGRPELPVRFILPDGSYATCLSAPARRYWELKVVADTAAAPYEARFLIPVYARR